jgi:tRNA(adenine34) deaminase
MADHNHYMAAALKEAEKALKTGDIPVGAVAVKDGHIIARAHNEKEKREDATAHAELLCLQKAAKKLGTWRLYGVELYSTLEPCPMCAGAMVLARIKKLYYILRDPKTGAAGTVFKLTNGKRSNHRIISSRLKNKKAEEEYGEMLRSFFKKLRKGYLSKSTGDSMKSAFLKT